MSNLDVIENKVSAIVRYLKILKKFHKYSQKEIENDINLRGSLERYLYLVTQASIDLAEAVIAYKQFRKPSTIAESFHILSEEDFLDKKILEKMVRMAGFRNVMAHDYEDIDYSIVYDVLIYHLKDIEDYITIIKKKLGIS